MNRYLAASAALGMLFTSPALADDLKEMVDKLPAPEFSSQKSATELELCIGVGAGALLPPMTLRGPNQVLIYAGNGNGKTIAFLVSIEDEGSRRAISLRASGSFDDRIRAIVDSCIG